MDEKDKTIQELRMIGGNNMDEKDKTIQELRMKNEILTHALEGCVCDYCKTYIRMTVVLSLMEDVILD